MTREEFLLKQYAAYFDVYQKIHENEELENELEMLEGEKS